MKHTRKILAALIIVMTILMTLVATAIPASAATTTTLYFNPGVWNKDGAIFRAWTWGGTSADAWVVLSDPDGDGIFEGQMPSDRTDIIFLRAQSGTTEWNGEWNRHQIKTSTGKNCYSMSDWSAGSWSTITYYLKGSFNSWGDANPMSSSGSALTATINLQSGSYTFKINSSANTWLGSSNTINDTVSNLSFTASGGDCTIKVTKCGAYTFKLANGKLTVTRADADGAHAWVTGETVDPTCTEAGYTNYSCKCGASKTADTVDALDHDMITDAAVAPTCTATGLTEGSHCSRCDHKVAQEVVAAKGHTEVVDAAKAPSCTATGLTEGKHCSVCNEVLVAQTEVPVVAHSYVEGTCSACGAEDPDYEAPVEKEIVFEFGANGSATHKDGSTDKSTYTETNGDYTLSITGGSKFYPSSYDAKGNSCIKLGSSSAVGKFTFVVPDDVTKVIINIAGYKGNTAKITVNGQSYTISTLSNNGEYTAIEVDTTTTKTVTFTTVSGGYRAMLNSIVYVATSGSSTEPECTHSNTTAIGEAKDPTCIEPGITAGAKCADCGETITAQEELPATGEHNYVDGQCSMCGKEEPTSSSIAGRYYIATVRTSGNYFWMTSALGTASTKRYQAVDSGLTTLPAEIASPEDGYVFVVVENGDGTYSIYAEGVDGDNYLGWTSGNSGALVSEANALKLTIDVADEKYNIHFAASDAERYLALNGTSGNNYFAWYKSGQKQDLVLVPVSSSEPECEHTSADAVQENVVNATCSAEGSYEEVIKCSVCGEELSRTEKTIDKLPHTEVIDKAVAATCTATGLTEGKHCSVCETVLVAQTETAKLSHTAGEATEENVVPATCKAAGSYEEVIYCSVCSEELSRTEKTIDKLAHTPATAVQENVVDATCKAAGSYDEVVKCSVCSEELSRTEKTIDKLAHTEAVDAAKDATCTETGLTEGKHCSVCNEILVAQEVVAAKGHTEVVDEAVAATCTTAGKTEGKHCSVCNEILVAQEVVAAKGHTEVVDEAVAATCTTAGKTEGKHCSVCNEVLVAQEVVDALDHDMITDAAVAPTCTETGLTEGSHCSRCDYKVAQEVVAANGHTPGAAANCTTAQTCTVCSAVINAALGHSFVGGNCSVCGAEDPDHEHSYVDGKCECGDEITSGYMLYIYNGDGTVGMVINGSKSASEFSLKSAIEDARVFADNGFLFGITGTPSFVVEFYEDSTENESFEIGSDVTVKGNGHVIQVTEDITISGGAKLIDTGINANGADSLTVSGLTFEGNSWINSGSAEALVVSGVKANAAPKNSSYNNSRNAFISLGRSEQQPLDLTVENCDIVVPSGTDPILGWANITAANIVGNTFGSESAYQNSGDAVKIMSIADGAVLNFVDNTVYSNYNGIVLYQNTSRDNSYTVTFDGNEFHGEADHIWIELSTSTAYHGSVNLKSNNTINGAAVTVNDIKTYNAASTTGYAGVDVVLNGEGKVIGGTMKFASDGTIADGYELDENGNVVEVAPTYVAEINGVKYETLIEALLAAVENGASEVKLLQSVREKMPTDIELVVNADLLITADSAVTAQFYNDGTSYDFIFNSNNNNTITIGENVTFQLEDRVIWLGYYGNNVDVVVNGTLAGYQIWHGADTTVSATGTLKTTGEALVLRRGATLTVEGGKVDANYFNILAGNIFAQNATIDCGAFWIANTGGYAGEGNVSINIWDSTLTSSGNLKSVSDHSAGVSIDVYDSVVKFEDFDGYGASQLSENTTLAVNGENAALTIKSLENNGTIEVYDNASFTVTGAATNNGNITLEAGSSIVGPENMGVVAESNGYDIVYEDGKYTAVEAAPTLSGSGTEADPFVIGSLEDLKVFRDMVNAGTTFDNQFVVLTADVDLGGESWEPIGNSSAKFLGTFDGKDHTISNLVVDIERNNAGLFGFASVIKNVNINNAKVSGLVCVGALVGELESSVGTVDNCHVTGNIQITGENSVGGLAGKGYANIKNSSVVGDGTNTSFVKGVYGSTEEGDNVGGIIGHLGEGNTLGVSNSTVKNIKVLGTRKIGGIVGTTARANDMIGNTVDGLVIESTATAEYADANASTTTIGGIVGNYFGSATSGGILQDSAVSNVEFVLGNAKSAGVLVGGDRVNNGGAPVGVVASGSTVNNVVGATNEHLLPVYAAKIGDVTYETLEEAFAAAQAGDTIVLLADATPSLTSQRAITKAAVIDLNSNTLTLTEDDLYFGTTEFKNGTIVVDPSVKPSTAVFWMFANQTLTFNGVKLVATGVTGTYLIGLDGDNADLNLIGGSEILVENTTALDLDIICVNASTGNDIVIENSKVNVTNLDGRVFFRGNYTVKGASEIALEGITKAGFRIEDGQTLSIEDTSSVIIAGEPRDGGIHLTSKTSVYNKADTATVVATVNRPAVAVVNGVNYSSLTDAIAAAQAGETITFVDNINENVTINKNLFIDGGNFEYTGTMSINTSLTVTIQNVKFVQGSITEAKGTHGTLTIKGCTFEGGNNVAYAISVRGGDKLVIENTTANGYTYGMLYVPSAVASISVKDVTVSNVAAAFNISYSGDGSFENVVVTNAKYGVHVQNYGHRVFTFINCTMIDSVENPVYIQEKSTANVTFAFEGTNQLSALATSQYANLVLAAADAKLVAPQDYNVTTNVTDSIVMYVDGAYVIGAPVAQIGEIKYATVADAIAAAQAGDTITLIADVTEDAAIPSGIIFNGNGYQIDGTLSAEGDLTIEGHTRATSFNAGFYNHVITIGEGACLELTGTGRMTIGWGNTFNITGSISDAKAAQMSRAAAEPSLIVPGGVSITGSGATFNVTNAYIKLGNTSSKNSAASDTFDINFTNSIVEFTNQFTLSAPTSGMNPTFNVNIKDSVVSAVAKLCFAAPGGNVVIDNSDVTTSNNIHNSGNLTVKNGSSLTGSMIQYGENGGNSGTITVDGSEFTIRNDNVAHAMDGKGTGKLNVINNGTATIDYITATETYISAGSSLITKSTGLEVETEIGYDVSYADGKYTTYKLAAKIGDVGYSSLLDALTAAQDGETVVMYADAELHTRLIFSLYTAGRHVTLDGNGYRLFASSVQWGTGNGKHLININCDNVTIKNIVLDCNGIAEGANIYKAQNAVLDNVSIINKKGWNADLTVNGSTLTVKNKISAKYIDVSLGKGVTTPLGIVADDGAVFEVSTLQIASAAYPNTNLDKALATDGTSYYSFKKLNTNGQLAGYSNSMSRLSNGYAYMLLEDATIKSNVTLLNEGHVGNLYINGHTLTVAEGKAISVAGNLTLGSDDNIVGLIKLTSATATLTAPEGLNVVSGVDGLVVKYSGGSYVLFAPVAQIGSTKFATIKDAVDAANAGDTILLLSNVVLSETVTIDKEVVIDIAGYTISAVDGWVVNNENQSLIGVGRGGSLTINDSIGGGVLDANALRIAINLTNYGESETGEAAKLVINGGKLLGGWYAIAGNGSRDNTYLEINGGEVEGKFSAIYHPQYGDLTITGGKLVGYGNSGYGGDAIGFLSGNLTITGGEFVGMTMPAITVENIGNGGYQAIGTVSITGGTFITNAPDTPAIESIDSGAGRKVAFVSGGKFNADFERDLLAEGLALVKEGDYYVVKAAVASVNGVGYYTLEEAIQVAQAGDTVALLTSLTLDSAIVLDKAITLDGQGNTITSTATRAINVNVDGAVSIKNLTVVGGSDTERAINVIQKPATLTIDNVVAENFKYTVNVANSSSGSNITINGGKFSGYAAINITGNNTTVVVNNAELVGINNAPLHASNDFGVIALGSGTSCTGISVTVNGGKLTATSANGNKQYILCCNGATGSSAYIDAELEIADGEIFSGDPDDINAAFREAYKPQLVSRGFITKDIGNGMVGIEDRLPYYIGADGYWYFNGEKTEHKAVGTDGNNFTIGDDGYWYLNGEKTEYKAVATDADQYTIGEDGYWYLNGTKTEYKAIGQDGNNYTIGADGYWYLNGEKTEHKAVGTDGDKVHIGDDGYWYINDVKTEYKAVGEDGKTPMFKIESGHLWASFDNVDWTDLGQVVGENGKTPEFKVENGKLYVSYDDGATWADLGSITGADGVDGVNGKTPKFEIRDGNLWVSYDEGATWADLGKIVGSDGVDGINGKTPKFEIRDGKLWVSYDEGVTWADLGTVVGSDGSDGADGSNGINGKTPTFKIEGTELFVSYDDGASWTSLGTVVGSNGADGSDGVDGSNGLNGKTPTFKIEGTELFVSYDEGASWTSLGTVVGSNGSDGADGSDGLNGKTPSFKIEGTELFVSFDDGASWTSLGTVVGSNGSDGADGTTPTLKIEDGHLHVSYDGGNTWTDLGNVTGADGSDGADGSNGINGKTPSFKIEGTELFVSFDDGANWTSLGAVVGSNGADGSNGLNGKTPMIKIEGTELFVSYDDGASWTSLGKVVGADGTNGTNGLNGKAPMIKIEGTDLWVSYDDGASWTSLGKVVGADGTNGTNGLNGKTPKLEIRGTDLWVSYDDGETWTNLGKIVGTDGTNGTNGINGKTPSFKVEGGHIYVSFDDGASWSDLGSIAGKDGTTPSISENGNWIIGGVETEHSAIGKDGKNYTIGEDGFWYVDGVKTEYRAIGIDGKTPTFKIDGGNLYVSYDDGATWTDLGRVVGKDGITPHIGENGHWWIGETDTGVPAKGQDGRAPFIGENGHWWIGDTDTGISAEGKDGLNGKDGNDNNKIIIICIAIAAICIITTLVAIATRKYRYRWWILT